MKRAHARGMPEGVRRSRSIPLPERQDHRAAVSHTLSIRDPYGIHTRHPAEAHCLRTPATV